MRAAAHGRLAPGACLAGRRAGCAVPAAAAAAAEAVRAAAVAAAGARTAAVAAEAVRTAAVAAAGARTAAVWTAGAVAVTPAAAGAAAGGEGLCRSQTAHQQQGVCEQVWAAGVRMSADDVRDRHRVSQVGPHIAAGTSVAGLQLPFPSSKPAPRQPQSTAPTPATHLIIVRCRALVVVQRVVA
eukprot:356739-Chlamydomonas_euryale.AAC.4